jgi:hypothetical protein
VASIINRTNELGPLGMYQHLFEVSVSRRCICCKSDRSRNDIYVCARIYLISVEGLRVKQCKIIPIYRPYGEGMYRAVYS